MKKLMTVFLCLLCMLAFSSCNEKTPEKEITETTAGEPAVEKDKETDELSKSETIENEEKPAEESKEETEVASVERNTTVFGVYGEVVNNWYDIILNRENSKVESKDAFDIKAIVELKDIKISDDYGYCITDVNGDGTEELMTGHAFQRSDGTYGNMINALYGLKNGVPELLYVSFNVNRLSLRTDGSFYVSTKSSAVSYGTGVFDLTATSDISYREFYYTDVDGDNSEIVVYKNNTGEMSEEGSEKTDMTMEAFEAKSEELSSDIRTLEWTPFSLLMEV